VLGWALFRAFVRLFGRQRLRRAAFLATVLTLATTTTMLVGVVALAGGGAATTRETGALDPSSLRFENPFSRGFFSVNTLRGEQPQAPQEGQQLSVKRFALVVYTLGPIGWVAEALVTAAILGYVARVRPTLVFAGAMAEQHRASEPGHHMEGRP
jgi:ABC-type Co2+ transport system permease subunit